MSRITRQNLTFMITMLIMLAGCDEVIFEEDITNSYLKILAPTNESNVDAGNIIFTWEAVEYADQYHIQIATPDFDNANQIILDSIITNTNCNKVLFSGNYEWRVRAENSVYVTSYFSNDFHVIERSATP